MIILDNVIVDRGSKYAVSGGSCRSADEARIFLAELKRSKKFAKARIIHGASSAAIR